MIALLVGVAVALLVLTVAGLVVTHRLQRSVRRVRAEAEHFQRGPDARPRH